MSRTLPLALALLAAASAAHAGYACRELSDPERRRWFQTEPCGPGYVHDPIPPAPLIREAPRLPDGWGTGSAGSEVQVLGFDERGRRVGVLVERGTSQRFISTDTVRVPRGGGGGNRGRR